MTTIKSKFGEECEIEIERLGTCTARRRVVRNEYYQWQIQHGFVSVVGDYSCDNLMALNNALAELKKKFKTIFSNK